ncbi:MAG: Unknown protein [uncultured Sulfurovum sp.]|uniref:Uncharacterized protein n=1 Tax=uncultured Sulfurovum sp. TaxID=269237 RepID=A0A6S6TJ27_9BACT|nr:MAG: Unknown protein [uncultured Sulfurovum sp.]
MSDLELILPTNNKLSFSLGDSPEFLLVFEEPEEIDIDKEMNRIYYIYSKYGMDFIFKNNQLKAFFLYKNQDANGVNFIGSFSLLPKEFFKRFNKEEFINFLQKNGFKEFTKKYPFSIDMLNSKYRLRYYDRPDNSYIAIDNGSKIRN